jgi:hypothetical protein
LERGGKGRRGDECGWRRGYIEGRVVASALSRPLKVGARNRDVRWKKEAVLFGVNSASADDDDS